MHIMHFKYISNIKILGVCVPEFGQMLGGGGGGGPNLVDTKLEIIPFTMNSEQSLILV